MKKLNKPARIALATLGAAGLIGGGFAIGAPLISTPSEAFSTGYRSGYNMARSEFCNLDFTSDGTSYSNDTRRADGLDDILMSDASCEDWQIRSWNESQAEQGETLRACRVDLHEMLLLSIVVSCIAPVNLI